MSLHNELAERPPLGWNSYDCYGLTVTEAEVLANARFMAEHLRPLGWQYVVIDQQWYNAATTQQSPPDLSHLHIDEFGRFLPAPNRFPSAANRRGFKRLADQLHALRLKLGIHVMRGIPRLAVERNLPILGTAYRAGDIADTACPCSWAKDMWGIDTTHPGGQAYYDSIVAMYADWGVDFIKADDMAAPVYHAGEIAALYAAIQKCGREMVLSLSPGNDADPANAEHLIRHCEMWRISGDMWDDWDAVRAQFERCRRWQHTIGPCHWPDADILPLGRLAVRQAPSNGPDRPTRLTRDEQLTLMTLWSIFRSPLMFGGDLPSCDEFTLALLTNPEVMAVNQDSSNNCQLFHRPEQVAWSAEDGGGEHYLALFNLADTPATVEMALGESDLRGACAIRDLWARRGLGQHDGCFAPMLAPHGAGLYQLTWTGSRSA